MATLEVNASYDDSQARTLIAAALLETGLSMSDAIITGGRIAARGFGSYTWPKTLESGENATSSQVRRVYASLSMAYDAIKDVNPKSADAFWAFTHGRRQWSKAAAILRKDGGSMAGLPLSPFDGGTLHKRLRNKRGRIAKGMKPKFVVRESEGKKGSQLDRYVQAKVANVGLTQSAWYNVLKALDGANRTKHTRFTKGYQGGASDSGPEWVTTPFPKWVIRQKGAQMGEVTFSDDEDRAGVILHSKWPWAATALEAGAERFIMNIARNQMLKYLRMRIARSIQSARKQA